MSEHDQAGTDSALTGECGDIGNYYSSTDNLKDGARYAVFSNKVLSSEWKLGTVLTENYVENKYINIHFHHMAMEYC